MLDTVNVYAAKTHFSHLLLQVEEGHEITIARSGRPVAKLVPITKSGNSTDRSKMAGSMKNQIWVADDFDSWPKGFWESHGKFP